MPGSRRSNPGRRLVAAALLITHLAACTTWRPMTLAPEPMATQKPWVLRVTLASGQRETLYAPRFQGDSLVGQPNPDRPRLQRAILVDSIARVEASRTNAGRTVLMFLVIGAVVVTLASVAASLGDLGNFSFQ